MKKNLTFSTTALAACLLCGLADRRPVQAADGEARSGRAFQTSYDLDDAGRLIAIHKPDGTVLRFQYGADSPDAAGMANPDPTRDLVRSVTAHRYDKDGILKPVADAEARVEFKYDRNGNRIEAADKTGTTKYFYDAHDRLTKVEFRYPELELHKSIVYQYGPDGVLAREAVVERSGKEGFYRSFDHDVAGRLQSMDVKGLVIDVRHDLPRHTLTRSVGGQFDSVITFDVKNRTRRIRHLANGSEVAAFTREFGDGGQLRRQVDSFGAGEPATTHHFDGQGRLRELRRGGLKYQFNYDRRGVLAAIHGPAGEVKVQRDKFARAGRIGRLRVSFDAVGRPLSMGTSSLQNQFRYDALGRLVQVDSPHGLIRHYYTAEGLHIGSRLGDQTRMTVPDPIRITGAPLLTSGPDFVETQPFSDMTVRFQGPRAQVQWHDRSGSPFGRLSVNLPKQEFSSFQRMTTPRIDTPDLQPLRAMGAPFSQFPAPRMPRFEDFTTAPRDPVADIQRRAAMGDRSAKMVWDFMTQPSYAPANPAARDRYWASGEYWQKDPYYREFAGDGIGPGGAVDYGWMFNPDQLVRAWFLNLGATGMTFAGALASPFRGMGAEIVERASDVAWNRMTNALPPQFAQAQRRMHEGGMDFRRITGLYKVGAAIPDLAENVSNFFERRFSYSGLTTKIGVVDDYYLRNGRLVPTERQFQWLPEISSNWRINWRKLGDFAAETFMDHARGRALDAIQDRLRGPSAIGTSQDSTAGIKGIGFDSLTRLGQTGFQPKGVKFDQPAQFFGNLGAIRGVSFDPNTKRLVLLGDGNPALPPLRFDDFVTAVRVVYGQNAGEPNDPTFSLDPADPDNPAGDWLQPVYRPGLLAGTHMGDVMLRADWVLKQYAFGVFADYDGIIRGKRISAVPKYQSYLELLKLNPRLLRQGEVCSRFWILPLEMKLKREGDTLVFTRATMQVRTQRMENVGGRLQDNPDSTDEAANQFAAIFTRHYDKFAREAPVLEEVRQAAKVVAIVKWLQKAGLGVNDFDIDWKQQRAPQPQTKMASRKPIRSLSITESVALWGLRPTVVRIVGGVELAARPVVVSRAKSGPIDDGLRAAMSGSAARAVGQVVRRVGTESQRYIAAVLPITLAGRQLMQQHPVYQQAGLTYALDGQRCIRTVMDEHGNCGTFDYDGQSRLTAVHYRSAADWRLDATLTEDGGRQISVRTPRGDRLQYRFGADDILSQALVNGRPIARRAPSTAPNSVKIEHVEEVVQRPPGVLTPKKIEKVVATEQVTHTDNAIRYEWHRPGHDTQHITCLLSDESLTIEGSCLAKTHLRQTDANTIVETGPQGRVEYQFDADSRRLSRIVYDNGDFAELSRPDASRRDAPTVFRARRGEATAEVRLEKDTVTVRDFAGNESSYEYRDDLLRRVHSAAGTIRYEYTRDGKHLKAIRYPDKTVERYERQIGPGMKRVTIWREEDMPIYDYRKELLRCVKSSARPTTCPGTPDGKLLAATAYPHKTVEPYNRQIGPAIGRVTTWRD